MRVDDFPTLSRSFNGEFGSLSSHVFGGQGPIFESLAMPRKLGHAVWVCGLLKIAEILTFGWNKALIGSRRKSSPGKTVEFD